MSAGAFGVLGARSRSRGCSEPSRVAHGQIPGPKLKTAPMALEAPASLSGAADGGSLLHRAPRGCLSP